MVMVYSVHSDACSIVFHLQIYDFSLMLQVYGCLFLQKIPVFICYSTYICNIVHFFLQISE